MSDKAYQIAPVVEELIQEVARDPRSSALRIERPERIKGLTQYWDELSEKTAGFTSAERELIRVHREEVAYLLRRRFLMEVLGHQSDSFYVDDKLDAGPRRSWVHDWSQGLEDELAISESVQALRQPECVDALSILSTSGVDRTLAPLQMYVLAASATRLVPSDAGRAYVAAALVRLGNRRAAKQLLSRMIESTNQPGLKSGSWSTLGVISGIEKDFESAREHHRRATLAGTPRATALGSWLCQCLQSGSRTMAERSAGMLDGCFAAEDDDLVRFVESQVMGRRQGGWMPTTEGRRLASLLLDSVQPASRRVLNAFL